MTMAERVTPASIRAELKLLGYTEIDTSGRGGDTWVDEEDNERPAVLVPREDQQDVRGYDETLRSAIDRLSWILGLDGSETIDRLTQRGDRFELRIVDSSTAGGRLPVVRAPDVMKGFYDVLRSGARAEFRGTRASYAGSDPDEVVEALDGIDLLAPTAGSFKLTAVSSEEAQLPLDPLTAQPDKSRLAVAATVRALHAAAETTREEIPDDVEDLLDAVDRGVSTTLLSGLDGIAGGTNGMAVEFSVRWDPTLPSVDVPTGGVVLSGPQLNRLGRLAEQLRHHEPQDDARVVGWVKTVSADELAQEGQPAGFVIVEIRREGRPRDVRIELSPEFFSNARPGASLLDATGTLERISARWHLTNPRNIKITDSIS